MWLPNHYVEVAADVATAISAVVGMEGMITTNQVLLVFSSADTLSFVEGLFHGDAEQRANAMLSTALDIMSELTSNGIAVQAIATGVAFNIAMSFVPFAEAAHLALDLGVAGFVVASTINEINQEWTDYQSSWSAQSG